MNGKIERFFGTLKQKLDGRTPAQAWAGVDPYTTKITEQFWFEAWDGLLCGYYLRR